jgi:hypothetical protein
MNSLTLKVFYNKLLIPYKQMLIILIFGLATILLIEPKLFNSRKKLFNLKKENNKNMPKSMK